MAIRRGKKPREPKEPEGEEPDDGKGKAPKRKLEITPKILMQKGGAAGVILAALVIGYFATVRGCTRSYVTGGYEAYEMNRVTDAQKSLQSALDWTPGHAGARVLLAKLQCDGGSDLQMRRAKENYTYLLEDGFREPQVYVGLGVVTLKMADKLEGENAVPLIKEARGYFDQAGEIPEALIGKGHCDLLEAKKRDDDSYLESARSKFVKLQGSMKNPEFRAQLTRDGLVDYYSGLGKALANEGEVDPASVKALKACSQLSNRWEMPKANLLRLEALRLATVEVDPKETDKFKEEGLELYNQARTTFRRGKGMTPMDEARMAYLLALGGALGRAGDISSFNELRGRAGSSWPKRLEPALYNCSHTTEMLLKGSPDFTHRNKAMLAAARAYRELIPKLVQDDAETKALKARVFNNWGWTDMWLGDVKKGATRHYRDAIKHFTEAAKLEPDDYVINRNLVLAHHRLKMGADKYEPFLRKARDGATGEWAADFGELQKVLEPK